MAAKFNSIVEFAELKDFMNVPLKNFSSGMLSRLGFAIAVDVQPDILLVDEILAVGDINFRQKCHKKIEEILAKGTTIIYVSHAMNEVVRLCKNALWLKDNRMYKYGPSEKIVAEYIEDCKRNQNK
jgi:ABC-type polysaccharide/polyol phosphate transport system ATPase subunit